MAMFAIVASWLARWQLRNPSSWGTHRGKGLSMCLEIWCMVSNPPPRVLPKVQRDVLETVNTRAITLVEESSPGHCSSHWSRTESKPCLIFSLFFSYFHSLIFKFHNSLIRLDTRKRMSIKSFPLLVDSTTRSTWVHYNTSYNPCTCGYTRGISTTRPGKGYIRMSPNIELLFQHICTFILSELRFKFISLNIIFKSK